LWCDAIVDGKKNVMKEQRRRKGLTKNEPLSLGAGFEYLRCRDEKGNSMEHSLYHPFQTPPAIPCRL
jgi:hypothetical protein